MQAAEPPDVNESFLRLLQGSAAQTASGHAFGHSQQQQQQAWPAQSLEPRVPGVDHSLRLDSMKNLGNLQMSGLGQEPSPPRQEPSAGHLWAPNTSGNSNAWGGSLWSGSNDNIWSTSQDGQQDRGRRSVDAPSRHSADDGPFMRPPVVSDSRRSLDSLSALQAIWQQQQQQQQQQHCLQQEHLHQQQQAQQQLHKQLNQQLSTLAIQEGLHFAHSQPQTNGFHHTNGSHGIVGNLHPGLQSLSQGIPSSAAHGIQGISPAVLAQANGSQLLDGLGVPQQLNVQPPPNRHGMLHNGALQNGMLQNGVGLGSGLTAAQLASLQDLRNANLLRSLEAKALLPPHLNGTHSLQEKLMLARQASDSLANLKSSALWQPPPPPPRGSRPQLPPPLMQSQPSPPPPRTNGLSPAKKATVASPQRASGRDRASFLGSRPKADMAALNSALEELVVSLRPSGEELAQQEEAFGKVSRVLKARWPHAKVHQFGSTANRLNVCNNNDIDMCLEVLEPENDPNYKSQLVEEMGDLMVDAGMVNVLPLPKARVPVVKFGVPETGTKVDITVNNILAIVNTKLLRDYTEVDGRLLKLAFIVKHWAKRRQVNDSYRGTLSSYCYVLMCIHHLQMRQPPVLPCLQSIQPPTHIRTVGRWSCDYYDKPMEGFGRDNRETLAELVWAFFENWAWRHDYNNAVVSIRTGCLLTKAQKDWTRRIGNERHLICIEDPFETSHDLGRTVDRQTSGVLHKEFERAACLLRDLEEPLGQLFEPYRAGKPD